MFYQKYPPPQEYKSLIECFYIWEGYPTTTLEIESPPSGLCSIVFNYKKEYEVSTSVYEKQKVPKRFVCGQAIKNYTLHISGEIGMAGIVLRPAGLYQFTGTPLYAFTGKRIKLSEVLNKTPAIVDGQLMQAVKHQDKITFLEKFLASVKPNEIYLYESKKF